VPAPTATCDPSNDPRITGTWKLTHQWGSEGQSEEVTATFVLVGKQRTLVGTADLQYDRVRGKQSTRTMLNGVVSGVYTEREIRIFVKTAVGTQSYEFKGERYPSLDSLPLVYWGSGTLVSNEETVAVGGVLARKTHGVVSP
jgi:hypothetical protein